MSANREPERLDRFMARANATYYATHDPFADFITAPEITQAFGELLGAWAAVVWQLMGRPDPVLLAEAGPGRGTLMADVLRLAARVAPEFARAARVHLVETSPRLRLVQAEALVDADPHWHDTIDTIPDGPLILLANEFLDALPIRQLVQTPEGWRERFVQDGAFVLRATDLPAPQGPSAAWSVAALPVQAPSDAIPADPGRCLPGNGFSGSGLPGNGFPANGSPANDSPANGFLGNGPGGSGPTAPAAEPSGTGEHPMLVVEHCEPALAIVTALARRVARDGGAVLLLDYGPDRPGAGDTLQALRDGRPAPPLVDPGTADLTAHVDFPALRDAALAAGAAVHGPDGQGAFLCALGLFQRTERLARNKPPEQVRALVDAAHRLAAPERMGRLFKAMALCHPLLGVPPGFAAMPVQQESRP